MSVQETCTYATDVQCRLYVYKSCFLFATDRQRGAGNIQANVVGPRLPRMQIQTTLPFDISSGFLVFSPLHSPFSNWQTTHGDLSLDTSVFE